MPSGIYKRIKPIWNKGTSTIKERKCEFCSVLFMPKNYRNDRKFCSLKCSRDFYSGSRNNMWNGGKKDTVCGICTKTFKQRHSGVKKFCSSKCAGKNQSNVRVGIYGANYRNGITPISAKIRSSLEMKLWRDAVFARDGYTCQKTGQVGGKLVVHHILNFSSHPELRTSIENGITLSIESHRQFHRKYGIKNNSREQLEEFLNNHNG